MPSMARIVADMETKQYNDRAERLRAGVPQPPLDSGKAECDRRLGVLGAMLAGNGDSEDTWKCVVDVVELWDWADRAAAADWAVLGEVAAAWSGAAETPTEAEKTAEAEAEKKALIADRRTAALAKRGAKDTNAQSSVL